MLLFMRMIPISYLYSFFLFFSIGLLLFFIFKYKPSKNELNNKILLKNLLEGLDMDLPDELKALDSSASDPQKFS